MRIQFLSTGSFLLLLLCPVHLRAETGWEPSIVLLQQPATTQQPARQAVGGGRVERPTGATTPTSGVGPVPRQAVPTTPNEQTDTSPDDSGSPRPSGTPSGRPPGAVPAGSPDRSELSLQLTNATLEEVIKTIMDTLEYAYILDPGVTGTVNLYTPKAVPKRDLFQVLEQVLKANQVGIIRQPNGIYFIAPIQESPTIPRNILVKPEGGEANPAGEPEASSQSSPEEQEPVARISSSTSALESAREQLSGEEGVITYLIPLNYIPASQMVTMAQAFASPGAHIVELQASNMLIVTDYRANIEHILTLVELLDTQYFDLNTIDLLPIRYNQASDVAEDLGKIFAPGDTSAGVRVVAIERLNSLLIVTRTPSAFSEVTSWIEKLDAPSGGSNIKTFVYPVENNTAANIAEILAQLFEDGVGLPSGPISSEEEAQRQGQEGRPTEPGFVRPSDSRQQQGNRQLGPSLQNRPNAQQGIRSVVGVGNVKIIVNEFQNSLVVQATEADYTFLLDTIRQLDVLPRQVVIDARIYSVELRNDLSFGVAAFLQERQSDRGVATTGSISAPGDNSSGGNLTLTTAMFFGGRELEAVLSAVRSKTDVKTMQAPHVLAMDGIEARVNVGAEVPVTTSSFGDPIQSGTTSFVNSIQFRPTGTTLIFLPRISASGVVTMDLAIEISNATGPALTPTVNTNSVDTTFLVRDGQTVMIAGIITDQLDFARSRVPLLGDIPIMGALFGQTSRQKRRFELIFLITPRVIHNLPTASELTLEFRQALKNTYEYINEQELERRELIERRQKETP